MTTRLGTNKFDHKASHFTDASTRLAKIFSGSGKTWDGKPVRVRWQGVPAKGAGAACLVKQGLIFMPKVDPEKLDNDQVDTLSHFITHERRHIILSHPEASELTGKHFGESVFELEQRIEDARIEFNTWYVLKGETEQMIRARKRDILNFSKHSSEIWAKNPFGALSVALQYSIMGIKNVAIHPNWKEFYDIGMRILTDGRHHASRDLPAKTKKKDAAMAIRQGQFVSLALAEEIGEAWAKIMHKRLNNAEVEIDDEGEGVQIPKDLLPPELLEKLKEKQKKKQEENETPPVIPSDEDEKDEGEKDATTKPEENEGETGEGETGEGETGDTKDDTVDNADNDDDDGGNDDKGNGENDGGDNKDDGNKVTNENDTSDEGDSASENGGSNDSSGKNETKKDDKGEGEENENEDCKNENEDKNLTIEDVKKLIKKMIESGHDIAPTDFDDIEEKARELDTHKELKILKGESRFGISDKIVIVDHNPDQFREDKAAISGRTQHVSHIIKTSLVAESHTRRVIGLKKGKLHPPSLHKLTRLDTRVMQKVFRGKKLDAAVQIVIDMSGSMECEKIQIARQIAILIGEACHVAKVPFEVLGYDTGETINGQWHWGLAPTTKKQFEQLGGEVFGEPTIVNAYIFKAFEDQWMTNRDRLGNCKAGGGNIDHVVIQWGAFRLAQRKEKRKLQIVIADGMPCGGPLMRDKLIETNTMIMKNGIAQFAFGIFEPSIGLYYPNHMVVNHLEELDRNALRVFDNFLKGRGVKPMSEITSMAGAIKEDW